MTYPEKLTSGYYRVRKTWKDSKSQVGAYRVLANAKAAADKNPGTHVFTNDGIAIYPVDDATDSGTADYRIHTVVKGDTLWDIAALYLGKGSRYPEIKTLNGLKSNVIYSGWKLKILVCNGNVLIFRFFDGSEITRIWKDRSRSQSWTDEMKATARQKALERRNQNA